LIDRIRVENIDQFDLNAWPPLAKLSDRTRHDDGSCNQGQLCAGSGADDERSDICSTGGDGTKDDIDPWVCVTQFHTLKAPCPDGLKFGESTGLMAPERRYWMPFMSASISHGVGSEPTKRAKRLATGRVRVNQSQDVE